jgi:hypothetical protein
VAYAAAAAFLSFTIFSTIGTMMIARIMIPKNINPQISYIKINVPSWKSCGVIFPFSN